VLDLEALEPRLRAALAEDVGPGDVTTDLFVPSGARGTARIVAKAGGVVAGVPVAAAIHRLAADGDVETRAVLEDGAQVSPGDVVLAVRGPAGALLRAERTALNFLMRLSGIATATARFVAAVEGTEAEILDTRKTTPGWRELERHAVRMGGGRNHRFALYDAVLVKENHLVWGVSIADALSGRPEGVCAIVEAESLDEFRRAMEAGADVVMLDDATPGQVRDACALRGDARRPLVEVSGGIRLDNVRAYAEAGADRISIGALTHSAPALDLSCRMERIRSS